MTAENLQLQRVVQQFKEEWEECDKQRRQLKNENADLKVELEDVDKSRQYGESQVAML